jgi:Zn-dependent M28 family amino/carboxypeptidase
MALVHTTRWNSAAVVAACALLVGGCKGDDDVPIDGATDAAIEADVDADARPDGEADVETDGETETASDADGGEADDGGDVPPVDCGALDDWITTDRLLVHIEALAAIAAASGGNRGASSVGWTSSRDYLRERFEEFGYAVASSPSEHPYWSDGEGHVLQRLTPAPRTYDLVDEAETGDFAVLHLSPPGDVSAPLAAVDLMLGPGNSSTSGCDAGDFAGFPAGAIALVQRGACTFEEKALNAQEAGAAAVLCFNQGDTPDRSGPLVRYTLQPWVFTSAHHGIDIPVLGTSYAVGEELAMLLGSGPVTLRLAVDTVYEIRTTENLTTQTSGGNPDQTLLLGAHIDGPGVGAGINGDATGLAALLEIARAVAVCEPSRRIGFALWGVTTEAGPYSSSLHLAGLSAEDRDRIHAYLDLEMLGSPNYAVMVHDGDGSAFGLPGVDPSAGIERFFVADMRAQGLPTVEILHTGNDTYSFLVNDIATGALTTYISGIKTEEEAALFGGTAGEDYDPCYRAECDTLDNIDLDITTALAKSFARAAQFFGIEGRDMPPE